MDEIAVSKFITETLMLINLDHPNVVRFQEIFQDEQYYYLVTELC